MAYTPGCSSHTRRAPNDLPLEYMYSEESPYSPTVEEDENPKEYTVGSTAHTRQQWNTMKNERKTLLGSKAIPHNSGRQ